MKRQGDRVLIVLGAGASIGSKRYPIESSHMEAASQMPSARNFFHDLFSFRPSFRRPYKRYLNTLGLTFDGLNAFLVQAWGLKRNVKHFDERDWKDINVEEIFTFLDIGEKMFNPRSNYHLAFSKAKTYLLDYIIPVLAQKSDGQYCEYLEVVFETLKPEDTIISFNWDTIADLTLERSGSTQKQYDAYIDLLRGGHPTIRKYSRRGLFLKLHGSINWSTCKNSGCKYHERPYLKLEKEKRLPRWLDAVRGPCMGCGAKDSSSFIIPPMSEKALHANSFMHKLWLLAREQLADARQIIFIGYSFPAGDHYVEWLFRQVHFLSTGVPKITIVNPELDDPKSPTAMRYKSIFRSARIKKYTSLKSYAAELIQKEFRGRPK